MRRLTDGSMAARLMTVALDRLVWPAGFLLTIASSAAPAVAEGSSGKLDPTGGSTTVRPEYDPTQPVPPGFHVEERSLSPLVPVGGVVLALSYAPVLYWG